MKKSIVISALEKELKTQNLLLEKLIVKNNAPDPLDKYLEKLAEYRKCQGSSEDKLKLLEQLSKIKISKKLPSGEDICKEIDYRIEIEGNIKRLHRALKWAEMSAI